MPRKQKVIDELELPSNKGIYCVYPFSKLDTNNKGCFKIGVTSTNFNDRFNQYFTCLPMGLYYVNFLVNPTKGRKKRENGAYYADIEKYIIKELHKSEARLVVSQTGVTGKSEWWFTNTQTIEKVFELAEKKFGGESIPYDLEDAFRKNEPKKNQRYFIGEINYY